MKSTLLALGISALALVCGSALAASPTRTSAFQPFTISSSKLQKEMSVEQLENTLMCKSMAAGEGLAANMDLLKNYDVLGTDRMDGTLTITTLAGRQQGKQVRVQLLVDQSQRMIAYAMVNGVYMLKC